MKVKLTAKKEIADHSSFELLVLKDGFNSIWPTLISYEYS